MVENERVTASQKPSMLLKRALVATALIGVASLSFLAYIGVFGNFHTIVSGKCYRSEQLTPQAITDAIRHNGIRCVLNLRGEQKNAEWYKGEVAACAAEKVDLDDINIGLGALPKPDVLQHLVAKLEAGPYPMLLHCRSGSDRTGLASAFYLHLVEKRPLPDAESEQVTWRYGHFPFGKAKSINAFFDLYHQTSDGKSLKEWLIETYPAEYEKRAASETGKRKND